MKTTIELPDELYRRAKVVASRRGRKIKDLVEEELRRVVDGPAKGRSKRTLAELMKVRAGWSISACPILPRIRAAWPASAATRDIIDI